MAGGGAARRPCSLWGAVAKDKKKKRKKWRDLGPLDRLTLIFRGMAWAVALIFVGSVLWAGVYRFSEPPGTLLMLERKWAGEEIIHPWTALEDISPNLIVAVIAAEDTRFCLHNGIDFKAIDEAMEEAENGKRLRGGVNNLSADRKERIFVERSQLDQKGRRSLDDDGHRNAVAETPHHGSLS